MKSLTLALLYCKYTILRTTLYLFLKDVHFTAIIQTAFPRLSIIYVQYYYTLSLSLSCPHKIHITLFFLLMPVFSCLLAHWLCSSLKAVQSAGYRLSRVMSSEYALNVHWKNSFYSRDINKRKKNISDMYS